MEKKTYFIKSPKLFKSENFRSNYSDINYSSDIKNTFLIMVKAPIIIGKRIIKDIITK